jgi:hypothetical protein
VLCLLTSAALLQVRGADILIFSFAGIANHHKPGLCCCFALLQVRGADILIFCAPHQFIRSMCKQLIGKIKPDAFAISLIKVRVWAFEDQLVIRSVRVLVFGYMWPSALSR